MPDLEDVYASLVRPGGRESSRSGVTDVAAKQHTEEDLAANREWLLQQEPGDENARLSEDVKRGGALIFDNAAAGLFNTGDRRSSQGLPRDDCAATAGHGESARGSISTRRCDDTHGAIPRLPDELLDTSHAGRASVAQHHAHAPERQAPTTDPNPHRH